MQLNIYVPNDRAHLLELLAEISKRTGRAKNELVLEALERFLRSGEGRPQLGRYDLGRVKIGHRGELYSKRLGR